MTVGTKEFYEMMAQFEKDCFKLVYGHKFEKDDYKSNPGSFYKDGTVNLMFKAYQLGYAFKRCIDLQA